MTLNPYAIVSCAGQRQRTQVVKKSGDPEWDCTFDFRIFGNHARSNRRRLRLLWSRGLMVSVWAKDRFRSVFLGQVQIPVEGLFEDSENIAFEDETRKVRIGEKGIPGMDR